MAKYKVHIFESSNDFVISSITGNPAADTLDYLIIAGGGSGGAGYSGGGGAGGLLQGNTSANVGTFTATVGGGAPARNSPVSPSSAFGFQGTPSTFLSLTAIGGGRGGAGARPSKPEMAGGPGGSGGGGGAGSTALFGTGNHGGAGSGTPGQGNPGGIAYGDATAGSAGGGGAGSAGTSGVPASPGGDGLPISWIPASYGTSGPTPGRWFAGGGGGGLRNPGVPISSGGAGGGGNGSFSNPDPAVFVSAEGGLVNTGGGGGGGTDTGSGGSGFIAVKYPVLATRRSNIAVKISYVTDVTTAANTYYGDQTVTLQVTTANVVTDETLYYSVNNASNTQVVNGNTGSFTITSNNYVEVPVTLNIVGASNITMQIRRNSDTGALLGESENVTIAERPISGGTIIESELYVTHVFTSTANLIVSASASNTEANVLVVAGGGGTGSAYSGGGGAGGMLEGSATLVTGQEYLITVGAGGSINSNGSPSDALGITTIGGGRGSSSTPAPGGSGGGRGNPLSGTGYDGGGAGTPGQGNPGSANGPHPYVGGNGWSGAGGGAGGRGEIWPTMAGGVGRVSALSPADYGTNSSNETTPGGDRYFGGGGAGTNGPGGSPNTPSAPGGAGGGGFGPGSGPRVNGLENTGGGGRGNSWGPGPRSMNRGGSGIVMVRYPK